MATNPAIRPCGLQVLVRLSEPAETTSGGIVLPETMRVNYQQGEVVAKGPGLEMPVARTRSVSWVEVGDVVIFTWEKGQWLDEERGFVREDDLIGVVEGEEVRPLNDWVAVTLDAWSEKTPGGLVIAEEFQRRPRKGTVTAEGPGRLILSGPNVGLRAPVRAIMMGIPLFDAYRSRESLVGRVVHWDADAEAFDIGREHTETVFIRAGDLIAVEAG